MVRPKNDRTTTAIYDDHEVITPPNRLVKAIKKVTVAIPEDDPVERAETALNKLSSEFTSWMFKECDRLDAARTAVKKYGFGKKTLDELFHAAHDIKGDATTFGYPVVAPAAESLCRVLEYSPEASRIPFALIDQHVDAIRAIVREYARPDAEQIAYALTKKLWDVSEEFLTEANKGRPDYIADIISPPLAPNGKG
jgi:HPt (histidine-containing phosphotransfer) domain-containing protein